MVAGSNQPVGGHRQNTAEEREEKQQHQMRLRQLDILSDDMQATHGLLDGMDSALVSVLNERDRFPTWGPKQLTVARGPHLKLQMAESIARTMPGEDAWIVQLLCRRLAMAQTRVMGIFREMLNPQFVNGVLGSNYLLDKYVVSSVWSLIGKLSGDLVQIAYGRGVTDEDRECLESALDGLARGRVGTTVTLTVLPNGRLGVQATLANYVPAAVA